MAHCASIFIVAWILQVAKHGVIMASFAAFTRRAAWVSYPTVGVGGVKVAHTGEEVFEARVAHHVHGVAVEVQVPTRPDAAIVD